MEQIDLFNLVDADNIAFCIIYLDEDMRLKRSEPLNATKTTLKVDVDPTINEDSKKVSKSTLVFNNLYDKSTAYKDDGSGNDLYMDKSFEERSTLIVKDSIEFIRIIYR